MEGRCFFNDIVAEPLARHNYEDWFECVKNYLISKDLWEVIISRRERPRENAVEEFARWRRNNAAALHIIRISCGFDNLYLIRRASEAQEAWSTLYDIHKEPSQRALPFHRPQEELEMGNLYKAISENNWSATKAFIDAYPSSLEPQIVHTIGENPLHVAVKLGQLGIVKELVKLVRPEYLEIPDYFSNTPLLIAATSTGDISIAKCLINENSKPLKIQYVGDKRLVPVTMAFAHGFNQMGRYLYTVTPPELFEPQNGLCGLKLLGECLLSKNLDIALDLLQKYKELLFAVDSCGLSTIENIACSVSFTVDKIQLPFWKQWIYHYIKIPSTTATEHLRVDVQQGESTEGHQGMTEILKMQQHHAQSEDILNFVCENLMALDNEKRDMILKALRVATNEENVEFLLRVMKANPELISCVISKDIIIRSPFFDAVANRKAKVFNLLRGFRYKHAAVQVNMFRGANTLLHEAARLGPPPYLNRISGAALQMQRELQWFKAVESMVDPRNRIVPNKMGFKPLDLFKENHEELWKEGEKWMKATSSSCSVVGALIVTIMFAVAFTVPGGNDQTSGYPIFLTEKLFNVFLIADALSLFSSTTSVLTFLGILTSRYGEEDFLYSLPKKLIIGLSTLFLSIATMMIAFSATIIIMLQHNTPRLLTLLPVILLAGVPITVFVLLQFPLLVEIISSTYGQSIVKKKVVTWP